MYAMLAEDEDLLLKFLHEQKGFATITLIFYIKEILMLKKDLR